LKVFAFCCLTVLLSTGDCHAGSLKFLYIEAAEGNSSGGHVALQISDKIYHYQYDDGYLRLFRQAEDVFLKDYRFKQNRNMHSAEIQVSEDTFDTVQAYFKLRYQQQKQHLIKVNSARQDLALTHALLALKQGRKITGTESETLLPRLPGAGLFYRDDSLSSVQPKRDVCHAGTSTPKLMAELLTKLQARYGNDFIAKKVLKLQDEIGGLSPVSANSSDSSVYGFAERYGDLINGLLALQVIRESKPVLTTVCFQIDRPGAILSPEHRTQLARYAESLQQSVLSLVNSKRPDWGYALFVSLARLQAVGHTLESGVWIFLDDTGDNGAEVALSELALYGKVIDKFRRDDENRWLSEINDFTRAINLDRAYAGLEIHANRVRQWRLSDAGKGLHLRSEEALPQQDRGIVPYLVTDITAEQLEKNAAGLERAARKLIAQDKAQNTYHLLSNNCVTALLATLDASVSGQSRTKFGGTIEPKLNPVPFQAYDAVLANYRVKATLKLPGYRELQLAKYYQLDTDAWVYARESNVFTSSLYRHHQGDAWFVFFTDDTVVFRPLYGAFNTLAAAGQSLWGLFNLPFGGDNKALQIGAKGFLASLPELAFFNIRKGSYPYPLEPVN
jgi:hypothetical protein